MWVLWWFLFIAKGSFHCQRMFSKSHCAKWNEYDKWLGTETWFLQIVSPFFAIFRSEYDALNHLKCNINEFLMNYFFTFHFSTLLGAFFYLRSSGDFRSIRLIRLMFWSYRKHYVPAAPVAMLMHEIFHFFDSLMNSHTLSTIPKVRIPLAHPACSVIKIHYDILAS